MDGWELSARVEEVKWWAEEHWYIQSIRDNWGFELVLSFMVDPEYEGDAKSQIIYEVVASAQQIEDGLTPKDAVAVMDLRKGVFSIKLSEFIDKLGRERDSAE